MDISMQGLPYSAPATGNGVKMESGMSSQLGGQQQQNGDRKRRSYKACLHCRSRKAKCDLGDILAPSAPPCSRCKRESRECVFVPSRRGGNYVAKKRTASGSMHPTARGGEGEEYSGEEGSGEELGAVIGGPAKKAKERGSEGGFVMPEFRREGVGMQPNPQQMGGPYGAQGQGSSMVATASRNGFGQMGNTVPGPTVTGCQHPQSNLDARINQQPAQSATGATFVRPPSQGQQQNFQQPYAPYHPMNPAPQTQSQQPQAQGQAQGQAQPQVSPQMVPPNFPQYGYQNAGPRPQQQQSAQGQNHLQSIASPTSPLRYSNLQTLLLPSPGATQTSTSLSPSNESTRDGQASHTHSMEGRSGSPTSKKCKVTNNSDPTRSNHHHAVSGAAADRERVTARPTPQSIVAADMHNESDALAILALASREVEDGEGKGTDEDEDVRGRRGGDASKGGERGQSSGRERMDMGRPMDVDGEDGGEVEELADDLEWLERFDLVKKGIVKAEDVIKLCEAFFRWHHIIFPMVPAHLIPNTPVEVALFSRDEGYLLTAIIIIASRHNQAEGMKDVHDKSWAVMREHLVNVTCLGGVPTVGLVEGLLLLAENIPRDPDHSLLSAGKGKKESKEGLHGIENRQAWTITGMAIRLAYGLGLDQISTQLESESENTPELERARLAWTYCFLFDRHTSIRLGKGFWSRGPTRIMFRGYSNINQTGPAAAKANFPLLCMDGNGVMMENSEASDLGSLVQAYVELTQLYVHSLHIVKMSNAHDVLYPSRARTHSLVTHGEYFKYMDDFNISLETFKAVWSTKQWHTFPLEDIVWCTFHYCRLYITAFSFQAHVERALINAQAVAESHEQKAGDDEGLRPMENLFPRGGAASPDARYIYESIRAATEILEICVHSLHPGGALPYLPSRFTLFFQYSAVFLLKAVYSGAMVRADTVKTLQLIDRLCICMASSSQDKDHPAVRYAQMLRVLSRRLAKPGGTGTANGTAPSSPKPAKTTELPVSGVVGTSNTVPAAQPMPQAPAPMAVVGTSGQPQPQAQWQPPAIPQPDTTTTQATLNQWMPPYQVPSLGPSWANSQSIMQGFSDTTNLAAFPTPGMSGGQGFFSAGNGNGIMPYQQQYDQQQQIQQQDVAALYASMDQLFEEPVPDGGGAGFDFDLADFWSKVGPGEAQGGFPFR